MDGDDALAPDGGRARSDGVARGAAAAGLAGDAKRWALAVRGERDDGNERTLAFAKAVRDLHYAGLVASKRGRFSAVTT